MKQELKLLSKNYTNLKHYLNFKSPLQLVVATILSAQVRDVVVNAATPELFKKYRNSKEFAEANLDELTELIKKITFANNKAKYIKQACKILSEKYNGKVPKTIKELTQLPGVGKKTANAILQNAYNIVEGIVVDTHVLRVTYRLGWTTTLKNATISERELMKTIPQSEWKTLPWLMKEHGRAICKAPKPNCNECFLSKLCPKQGL